MRPGAQVVIRADLHTHSTASDGELSPSELVLRAAREGLSVLALTDHDTTAGLSEAATTAKAVSIALIGGVEISTEVDSGELHVLGYSIDPSNRELITAMERFRGSSVVRLRQTLTLLRTMGIDLPDSTIQPRAADQSVGRPHVARALVAAGHATSIADAFDRYLGDGRSAFVPKERMTPVEAVGLLSRAHGIPVLAHPHSVHDLDRWLPSLVEAGLAGLECYYGEYDPLQREELARLADSLGLLVTGGSDFHGDGFKDGRALGSVDLPPQRVKRFLAAVEHPQPPDGARALTGFSSL